MTKKQDPAEPELDLNDPAVIAFIQAEADRAAAPFVGKLPKEAVDAFRERTATFLATHPDMVRLVRTAMRAPAQSAAPPARLGREVKSAHAPAKRRAGRR